MSTDDLPSRRWFLRYKGKAIFLILLAAAAIGGALYVRHVEYVGGTKNSCGDGVLVSMAIDFVVVLASMGFMIHQIFYASWPPYTGKHALLRVVLSIAPVLILIGGFVIEAPLSVPFLRGFERWVLHEVDADAIQQWLATEGRNYAGGHYREDFPDELPDYLVRFKPKFISFRDSASEGGPSVEFGWGGGLANWGLIIGSPDMPTPKEGAIDLSKSEIEFRRPVKPGVYVFSHG